MLKVQPLLKNNASKSFWQNYYSMSGYNSQYKLFADAVVLDNPTTEGFTKNLMKFLRLLNQLIQVFQQ